MEQIPKETIEIAADFIYHLTDLQAVEMMQQFRKAQPVLHDNFIDTCKSFEDEDTMIKYTFLMMTIYYSYRYYNVNLQPVSSKEIIGYYKIIRARTIQYKGKGEVSEIRGVLRNLCDQNELADYLERELFGTTDEPADFDEEHSLSAFSLLVVVMHLFDIRVNKVLLANKR